MSIWVLMDENTRGMVLPGKSGVHVEGVTLGDELPVPSNLTGLTTDRQTTRTVAEEDIDKNKHMNNTRYLAWAYDLLDDMDFNRYGKEVCPKIERTHPHLKRMAEEQMSMW